MKRSILAIVFAAVVFMGCVTTQQSICANKLDTIIIPKVNFRNAPVAEVATFLATTAKEVDPQGEGINIVLVDRELQSTITMSIEKVSLRELLTLVCEMANLEFEIRSNTVVLRKATTH